jgi:hypothetical protein
LGRDLMVVVLLLEATLEVAEEEVQVKRDK